MGAGGLTPGGGGLLPRRRFRNSLWTRSRRRFIRMSHWIARVATTPMAIQGRGWKCVIGVIRCLRSRLKILADQQASLLLFYINTP